METQLYLRNATTLKLDITKCNGCSMCVEVCPHDVFRMLNKRADILNMDRCMECGACMRNCPENAIDVRAGVGCAAAIIFSKTTGGEVTCGCGEGEDTEESACCS